MSVELSRRQAKRVDEHLRKTAIAERKSRARRSKIQYTTGGLLDMIDTSVFYGN